ncbi:MAG: YceI family protein [Gammaproteobacteria bacterium]|nr:YceI family protein [Gammaproteobacteria bacterium]
MSKKTISPFLLATLFLVVGNATAADYVIDTEGAHASINFKFNHLGYSWLSGTYKTFSGNFKWDAAKPEATVINVEVDVNSLDSNHAERDKHIRSDDFLDVKKYPTAKFDSTSVTPIKDNKLLVKGNLTLHGVTKEIVIDARPVGEGEDPWGGYRAGFEGTVTLNTVDFGMPGFVPTNQVHLELLIEGVRQ